MMRSGLSMCLVLIALGAVVSGCEAGDCGKGRQIALRLGKLEDALQNIQTGSPSHEVACRRLHSFLPFVTEARLFLRSRVFKHFTEKRCGVSFPGDHNVGYGCGVWPRRGQTDMWFVLEHADTYLRGLLSEMDSFCQESGENDRKRAAMMYSDVEELRGDGSRLYMRACSTGK